jgi:hypothetical protein
MHSLTSPVQELAEKGVCVGGSSTRGLQWAEIDDPPGLDFAQQNVFPQLSMERESSTNSDAV